MIARCKSSCCAYGPDHTCCYFCKSQSECVADTPDLTCSSNPKTCGCLVELEVRE